MSTKYCLNCERVVAAKRVIGVGTYLMTCLSLGMWLVFIPFYSKRCPICKDSNFGILSVKNALDKKVKEAN